MENYGFLSILPIIVAITMSIKTKNVIVSLFCSVFLGVLMLSGYNPINATQVLITDYFVAQVTDSYNAGVIVLMIFIGGFIELMLYSGGAYAFATSASKFINSKKKAQMGAYLGGIIVFFSDLGTPLIVGPVFSAFFHKLKVSKEKLAYILDSTSSPICVLIPFIGWGVFVIGLLQKEFINLSLDISDYGAFVSSIPFNIYSILSVTIIPAIILLNFDFKAMKKYDFDLYTDEKVLEEENIASKYRVENAKPSFIWLPILVLLITLFSMLGVDFLVGKVPGSAFRAALSSGYLYAAFVLGLLIIINKTKKFNEVFKIYLNGMLKMTEIAIILILAWSLGLLNKNLGTSVYIVNFVKAINLNPSLLPAIIFIIGALISFATGSSWGVFSIMIPLVIPMAIALDAPLYVTIGAVLSGGVFGDHCSPISATTILSSAGAGCTLIDHVKSQLPYAIFNASFALIIFIVSGFMSHPIVPMSGIIIQILVLMMLKLRQTKMEKA